MKKIIAILCVVSLLAALFVGCNTGKIPADEPTDKESGKAQARTYILSKVIDKKLAFVCDDKLIVTEHNAYERKFDLIHSLDGAAAVCHREYDALLYIHDGTVEKIADLAQSCCLSTDGSTVAFSTGSDLYLYHAETGKTVQVSTDEDEVYSYALSPDGKTLAYMTANDKISRLFVYRDGAAALRAEFDGSESNAYKVRYYLVSTNNSADIIYVCSDVSGVISVDGAGNKTDVGNSDSDSLFYLNADHSQLLFYNSFTYLSKQGQEGIKFTRGALSPVQPEFVQFPVNQDIITCHFEDLSAVLMSSGSDLKYPDANGEFSVLETGGIGNSLFRSYLLDYEGRYLFYHSQDLTALYRIDLKNGAQPTQVAQGAENFAISKDCRTLYYVTTTTQEDGDGQVSYSSTIYWCNAKDGSQQKKVVTHRVLDMYCTEGGNLFFRAVEDGHQNLYTLTSGGEVERILENVKTFYQEENGMIWVIVDEDYYIVYNGKMIQLEVTTME